MGRNSGITRSLTSAAYFRKVDQTFCFKSKAPRCAVAKFHWDDYIEERKDVMMGKPVFKGTRLTVELILTELGAGTTSQQLLDNYPTLKPEHIRAAMLYAADVIKLDA